MDEFLRRFDRRNLLPTYPGAGAGGDLFPAEEARTRAMQLLPSCSGRRVILLGSNVANAFRFGISAPFLWVTSLTYVYATWTYSPHPSGRNRWWNDLRNVDAARRFWREASRLVDEPGEVAEPEDLREPV